MKRLTKSTVIGTKRKQEADNKENENSLGHENSNPPQQSQLSSYKTPRPFCGIFQASLSTPLSVLTNVCSKEVSVRNVSNRTPLSAISSTPPANQATDLTMESLTGSHTHERVGRVLQPSLRTPNSVLTNENVAINQPHIDAQVGPSTTHAGIGYSESITNLIKKPSSRLINTNNRSASDGRNLHSDFNQCSEQEDIIPDVLPVDYADFGDACDSCLHCGALFWYEERLNKSYLNGSLLPMDGAQPKFAQLYIHDTENEINNRVDSIRHESGTTSLHLEVVNDIKKKALDDNNVLVKSFRMTRSEIHNNPRTEVKMRLLGKRSKDARTYNLPTVSEVAALIVGDLDLDMGFRDILVESKTGKLKRISELNPAYLPMQYPILFPYGEDGYRDDIQFAANRSQLLGSRQRLTLREYFAFRLHERRSELSTLLHSKRLFQQFLVDAYTMVESGRLMFIRNNQKALRCEQYKGLSDALFRGDIDPSTQRKKIILPSSFTGGARYMIQNYQDVMAICRWIGYPNLFITFTCNPKWPEIQRFIEVRGLRTEDRPDIVSCVFKMKLDSLVKELKSAELFGPVKALIYTIEFQKRGLPHAHILLFLGSNRMESSPDSIDKFISSEISDIEIDKDYYKAVEEFMVHGPCDVARSNSPCMVNGRCTKYFPKRFVDSSSFDQDGYPIYRRCDDGRTITKNGIQMDNRYVVPHNRYLLLRYRAHLNVEWCNQSRSIKYLFKYINKANDRVTAEFYRSSAEANGVEVVDEINMYYDCRYVSASEATWRLLSYDIQCRTPAVERLSFHLPDSQTVYFQDDEDVETILNRQTLGESMFTEWFEANKKYSEARLLSYIEMPNKFVWKKNMQQWQPRQRGFSIGRIFYVPPGSGELYYLRCLLNIVRGPQSFEDIKTYNGKEYNTFKDACYARGLLDDDLEYIDAIKEASEWSTAHSLRKLFVTLLMANTMGRPEYVWNEVWTYLAEDAQYNR
ncbi:uncharacterized protein LOC115996940 [Ipomoea triloba]|uniref:uncharacterized protein LOC115996940 n=1 Tax=Ipomoea triloba TaxID=35885 RepID=UPI00125E7EF2|nr:uncharacterized protein LOC115996940 [Ipomoea triloba]